MKEVLDRMLTIWADVEPWGKGEGSNCLANCASRAAFDLGEDENRLFMVLCLAADDLGIHSRRLVRWNDRRKRKFEDVARLVQHAATIDAYSPEVDQELDRVLAGIV
jgi:hypothetical protein